MSAAGILLSILLGFFPMLLFATIVYWIDRYEKEPLLLLGGVFIWGAVIAAGAAFIVNSFLGLGIYLFTGSQAITEITTASAVAPIIEESLKGAACLLVFVFFRREFDSILDGIIYASIAAIGFAATENIYYLYAFGFSENGISGLLWMFFVRVILVGWQHPFYTSFIGIGLAVSRLNRNLWIKVLAPLAGWCVAVITHSIHNTISSAVQGAGSLWVGAIYDWSGWAMMGVFILWALYREQRWIISQLSEEVSLGTITAAQYRTACSAWSQSLLRINALFSGRFRVTNRFYRSTAELAYKKYQSSSLGELEANRPEIDQLRLQLKSLSPLVG